MISQFVYTQNWFHEPTRSAQKKFRSKGVSVIYGNPYHRQIGCTYETPLVISTVTKVDVSRSNTLSETWFEKHDLDKGRWEDPRGRHREISSHFLLSNCILFCLQIIVHERVCVPSWVTTHWVSPLILHWNISKNFFSLFKNLFTILFPFLKLKDV